MQTAKTQVQSALASVGSRAYARATRTLPDEVSQSINSPTTAPEAGDQGLGVIRAGGTAASSSGQIPTERMPSHAAKPRCTTRSLRKNAHFVHNISLVTTCMIAKSGNTGHMPRSQAAKKVPAELALLSA